MMNKYFTPEIDITQTNNGLDVLAISPGKRIKRITRSGSLILKNCFLTQ